MADSVKLSYSSSLLRAKAEFTREHVSKHELPPPQYLKKARAKMEAVCQSGEIAFYVVYETRFQEAWKRMRALSPDQKSWPVHVTLAAGAPACSGLRVEVVEDEKALALLTVERSDFPWKTWRYEWFKLTVLKKLRDIGVKTYLNNALLHAAFTRLQEGEPVDKLLLAPIPQLAPEHYGKVYSVLANKARRELAVMIRSPRDLLDKTVRDKMFQVINQAVRQVSSAGVEYRLLKKEFMSSLQEAFHGPESLGLDLPIVLLAAIGRDAKTSKKRVKAPKIPAPRGPGYLTIFVSEDRFVAKIVDFDMNLYGDASCKLDLDLIEKERKRYHLTAPLSEPLKAKLLKAIENRESLEGLVVAEGDPGQGARGPYLYASFQDAQSRSKGDINEDQLDIRELQQRQFVKAGQLVAEIRYKDEGVAGYDVYGNKLPASDDDEMVVTVKEGIIQEGGRKFYATADGLPVISGDSISLSKVFVHEGDVNLRSGNINFDGPVEIKGSIDSGAYVETTGDLMVEGTIRGAIVHCQGSITVEGGIVTGSEGRVEARGNIKAPFVENSNITCGNDLVVGKALLNSQVICGGSIKIQAQDGLIGGGHISCWGTVRTQNLGFKNGAVTGINMGVDWRAAQAVEIRRVRQERLQKALEHDRLALRELVQKSRAQTTKRHKEMKEKLQNRLQRLRSILDRVSISMESARMRLTYNQNCRIYVKGLLEPNVAIYMANHKVRVKQALAGIGVSAKKRRGSYVVPIEDLAKDQQEEANEFHLAAG